MLQRKYIGLFIELKQGKGGFAVFQCLAVGGYLLDNDCYVLLAAVLTQIQYGSVFGSHQLLRCMGTRLDTLYPLQIFALLCQKSFLFFLVVLHT